MLALTVCLFFISLLYFYPVTMRLRYEEQAWQLLFLPRVFGGYAKALNIPLASWPSRKKKPSPAPKPKPGLQEQFQRFPAYKDLLLHTAGRTSLDALDFELQVGAADPFATSMLAGACLAGLGGLRGVAAESFRHFPDQPRIEVSTDWSGGGLRSRFSCIFHLRAGDIIGILLSALWLFGKGRLANGKRA